MISSYTDHFPAVWKEAIIFLNRREKTIRANGRVLDKVVLNLPYSLTDSQRFAAVRDFTQAVGHSRIPSYFVIHGDTQAPHAHIIFIDADLETGQRVFKFSDAGSSYRLRKLWEDVLNRHLELARTGLQVSRWGKRAKEMHVANDNPKDHGTALTAPDAPKRPLAGVEVEAPAVVPPTREEAMDPTLVSTHEYAKDFLITARELEVFDGRVLSRDNAASKLRGLENDLKSDESGIANYTRTLSQARAQYERALAAFQPYRSATGQLKGFSLLGFKTRKRIAAEAAYSALLATEQTVTIATKRMDDMRTRISNNRYAAEQERAHLTWVRDTLGTDEELSQARAVLIQSLEYTARQIDVAKLEKLVFQNALTREQFATIAEKKLSIERKDREQSQGDIGH